MQSDFTTGDTSPDLTFTVNADLTGSTLELHIRKPDGVTLTRAGAVVDGPAGKGRYTWVDGELDQAGPWKAEVQVTFANQRKQTFGPDNFYVREQMA